MPVLRRNGSGNDRGGREFLRCWDTVKGVDGGTMKASYGDIDTPPLHPDCRCYLRPEDIRATEVDE
jgi:hypothetical protein